MWRIGGGDMCMVGMDQVSDPHHTNMFVMFVMKLLHVIPWEQYVKLLWRMAHTLTQAMRSLLETSGPRNPTSLKWRNPGMNQKKWKLNMSGRPYCWGGDFSIVDNW